MGAGPSKGQTTETLALTWLSGKMAGCFVFNCLNVVNS